MFTTLKKEYFNSTTFQGSVACKTEKSELSDDRHWKRRAPRLRVSCSWLLLRFRSAIGTHRSGNNIGTQSLDCDLTIIPSHTVQYFGKSRSGLRANRQPFHWRLR